MTIFLANQAMSSDQKAGLRLTSSLAPALSKNDFLEFN
jgi:hypothetical protein